MDIGFIWNADKYKEAQRKHNVQFYEVVSAFDDTHAMDMMLLTRKKIQIGGCL